MIGVDGMDKVLVKVLESEVEGTEVLVPQELVDTVLNCWLNTTVQDHKTRSS